MISNSDITVLVKCVRSITHLHILEEIEIHPLLGIESDELDSIITLGNPININDEKTLSLMKNVLNTIVGYPHGKNQEIETYVGISISSISDLLDKLDSA